MPDAPKLERLSEFSFTEFASLHWRDGVEVLILAVLVYFTYRHFKETRGARILLGLLILLVALTLLSGWLKLEVIGWLLKSFSVVLALALIVIFQPELRRGLAELGSSRLFFMGKAQDAETEALCEAVDKLSNASIGALIAIERGISLKSIAETGVGLDSKFSPELIQTIFVPKSPLHDGGVILSQSRVAAAGCVFPVSQREMPDRSLGLRHRAGIGITEETDALVIIVSEETGAVSIANAGKLEKDLSHTEFRQRLASHLFGALDEPGDPGEKEAPAPKKPTKPSHEKSAAQSVEG